mgnify:CR=1 FL=1
MIIAGVDEVGVGCLAGPVVASCVILPEEINEIFKLSEKLNKKGKKVRLFRLSGENNSSGFVNACITKTGFPCSVNFSDWGAYYDPEYYTASVQNKLKSTQLLFSNLISSPNSVSYTHLTLPTNREV